MDKGQKLSKFSVRKSFTSFFLKKKVKVNTRNISSRDTTPPTKENYLYITLFSLLLSYICLKLSYYIDLKSVLFFYLIFLFIYYLYITIDFLIIIYYIKYKITTPKYLPYFIQKQLIHLEIIINSGDIAKKHYYTLKL